VEANPRYISSSAAIEKMKLRLRPVIGWGLGSRKPKGPLAYLQLRWRQRFLRQFDAMIAYSQRGAAEYRGLGFAPERVFVASNAVAPRPQGNPPTRALKPGKPMTILFVGRLQSRKRIEVLIKSCAALPANRRPSLQIVGDGPARDELKQMAQQIYPQAEFMGSRYGDELGQLFDRADLFVLPGTGGLAIQQAMAHGLPIIASEGDGSQEDLVQFGNGWLIRPNDDGALQKALAEALSDPKRLRAMGEKSFELVKNNFNLENMVEAFIDAINEVMS